MRITRAGSIRGAIAGICLALAAPGCERKADEATAPEREDLGTPSAVYTVRGRVTSLPDPSNPLSEFHVYHEAIDNFVDAQGKVVGMGAMDMPFPLGEGVSVADLKIGDVVEVTFAVWWEPRRTWAATEVVKLPPDTPLEFGPAHPVQRDPAEVGQPETPPAETGS